VSVEGGLQSFYEAKQNCSDYSSCVMNKLYQVI